MATSLAAMAAAPPASELLRSAQALALAMEYDRVADVVDELLSRPDLQLAERVQAHLLKGSALAVVGDTVAAEKSFRLALRGDPERDLAPDTSPRILAVFRKVQLEERAVAEQARQIERARLIAALRLDGDLPAAAAGGRPLALTFRLHDPHGAVAAVTLHYRRQGESHYSALALQPDEAGRWAGQIPGEWTASERGFELEHYVSTTGLDGRELVTRGDAVHFLRTRVQPGQVADARPLYRSPWFWVAAGVATIAIGVSTVVAYERATEVPATELGAVEVP